MSLTLQRVTSIKVFVLLYLKTRQVLSGRRSTSGLAPAQQGQWFSFLIYLFIYLFTINLLFKLHITADAITLSVVQLHLFGNWIKCAGVKTCEYFQIGPRDDLKTCPWWFLLWQVDSWDPLQPPCDPMEPWRNDALTMHWFYKREERLHYLNSAIGNLNWKRF